MSEDDAMVMLIVAMNPMRIIYYVGIRKVVDPLQLHQQQHHSLVVLTLIRQ